VILRPYGIVIDGVLELGLELLIENGVIQEIRPHTGIPELFIVSPCFINAHSHLEYRGLMDKIDEPEYSGWIREITRLKKLQSPEEIRADCVVAANENIATGVGYVLEHSDRPYAAEAMKNAGLSGYIFQEVITIFESDSPEEKLSRIQSNASTSSKFLPTSLNPHAYQTVDRKTLRSLAALNTPLSIHAAETLHENQFTRDGTGPIADFYRQHGIPFEPTGKSVVQSLDDLGLLRANTQLVHCCALEEGDIAVIQERHASVAHCPRSNARLKCPPAPIRELLDAGVRIGLGLDSAASSGPIDMFAEMRAALQTSINRGRPITAEEVWCMATNNLYSFTEGIPDTRIKAPMPVPPLLKIHLQHAENTEQIIEQAHPGLVEWI